MKKYSSIVFLSLLIMVGCNKFLEEKPDKSLAIPSSLKDLRAILDMNYNNLNYPISGAMATDDYYLSLKDWEAISNIQVRKNYIWEKDDFDEMDWRNGYRIIFNANVVLDHIGKMKTDDLEERNSIEGTAYFFRALALHQLCQVFTLPGKDGSKAEGLPLRKSADINLPTVRAGLGETYQFIVNDLQTASQLLPKNTGKYKTRPTQAAAYGLLARVYLATEDYPNAAKYAKLALEHYSLLMDYNQLDSSKLNPFTLFNDEVIFHGTTAYAPSLISSICKIDSTLFQTYDASDRRRSLFFGLNKDGSHSFKGNYHGQSDGTLFMGIATDEIVLIAAEAAARQGEPAEARAQIEKLMAKRYRGFTGLDMISNDQLLGLILKERRKELVMRGDLRWSDLRRFNEDKGDESFTLKRSLGANTYELMPGDLRYAFLIPKSVIQESGISQNKH